MTRKVSTKKLYATGVAHPAPFSESILAALAESLEPSHAIVLDPFAGVGRIHSLADRVAWPITTVGVEIEWEWASLAPGTMVADALALPFKDRTFDAVVTSPTYGNRLADHHQARDGSIRRSYTHDLGRRLNANNSGVLHWGEAYRTFHSMAWVEARRVLRPGGRFVLNISDHIRGGTRQYVTSWHLQTLLDLGFFIVSCVGIRTSRYRQGTNSNLRVDTELVVAFDLVM